MGNLGGGEILVILLVALIVLGPTKLPAAVRQAGRFMGEIRRIGQGFQQELREAAKPLAETTETIKAANPRNVIAPPPADKNKGTAAPGKGTAAPGKGSDASGTAASGPAAWGTAAAGAGTPPVGENKEADAPTAANGEDAGAAADGTPSADDPDAGGPEAAEQDPESRTTGTA